MPLPDMAWAVLRKWWVFLPVLVLGVFVSRELQATGAEYVAEARILVVSPRTDNTLLDSVRKNYTGPAILATVELLDDEYREELRAQGLPATFEFDYKSEFPLVVLTLRGPSAGRVAAAVEVVAEEYAARVDQVQADRDIIGAARLRGEVTDIIYPSTRPPGSTRALAGLGAAWLMLAAGLAYGVDQFLLPSAPARRVEPVST